MTAGAIRRAKLQSNCHHQQTPFSCMSVRKYLKRDKMFHQVRGGNRMGCFWTTVYSYICQTVFIICAQQLAEKCQIQSRINVITHAHTHRGMTSYLDCHTVTSFIYAAKLQLYVQHINNKVTFTNWRSTENGDSWAEGYVSDTKLSN